MKLPKLYELYDRRAAIALFGPEAEARSLCDGQWVILPHAALCFARIGDAPGTSYFANGREFCWVADKPYRVSDLENHEYVPPEVVGRHAGDRAIHLFARGREMPSYQYLGPLAPSDQLGVWRGARDGHGAAHFQLPSPLPSKIGIGLGALRPGDLDHTALDAALDRLRRLTTVDDRLDVLRRLVEYWHGPIGPGAGFDAGDLDGIALPHPLRWWYEWAGRRTEILSGQNRLLDPAKLTLKDGLLELYVENQYVYQWGTPPEGDDPPVFGRNDPAAPWEPEGIRLSEHLVLACLFEAIMNHSPYGASTPWLDEAIVAQLIERIPPIAVKEWRWLGGMRFYAKGGAFMLTAERFENRGRRRYGYSTWVAAKTDDPLLPLKPLIGEDWEYLAI